IPGQPGQRGPLAVQDADPGDFLPNPLDPGDFLPNLLDAEDINDQIPQEPLIHAQRIFNDLELRFKTTPVIGGYIGAVVAVGSTLREIAE
ncbi:hypothetical protein FRC00_012952, partial [Tulasnella sp. 408]